MKKRGEDMGTILEVKDLSVSFPVSGQGLFARHTTRQVLNKISFSMEQGTSVGLVGESGSGKSTLVRTILGIQKHFQGEILHFSKNPQMVFQDPYHSLNPVKKVGWILREPLKLKGGLTKAEQSECVKDTLKRVGLSENMEERYPHELSGGQRQRVCIAQALMLRPSLLIADEPVSALDVTIQAQILELLLKLQEEMGLSLLFISHDLRVVYRLCSQVLILKDGRIVEAGDTESVYFSPKNDYTKKLLNAVLSDEWQD